MSDDKLDVDYKNLNKTIVFTDNDHRHAQLIIRLRYDNLTQSAFFRHIISGYIAGDERIQDYVNSVKKQSIPRKKKSEKLFRAGRQLETDLALDGEQIEDLFDLIAEEHPDL